MVMYENFKMQCQNTMSLSLRDCYLPSFLMRVTECMLLLILIWLSGSSGPSLILNYSNMFALLVNKLTSSSFPSKSFFEIYIAILLIYFIIYHAWALIPSGKERIVNKIGCFMWHIQRCFPQTLTEELVSSCEEECPPQWCDGGCWPMTLGSTVPITYQTT